MEVLGRDRRARRGYRGHHPQVQPGGRAFRGGHRGSPPARPGRPRKRPSRTDGFPPVADGHDRRRNRPRFRRRHLDRPAAERELLARRAHRRRVALRGRRHRARRRGLRALDVGVLSRARRAHVPVGVVHGPVQPEPARRSAGAVLPDGDRSADRRGRPLRDARRRHSQPGADDLHRRERDPHGPRSGRDGPLPPAGADVRADARAVHDPPRAPAPARVDRLRSEGVADRAGRRRDGRGDHRVRTKRGASTHRRVHAPGQRDRGVAPGIARRADAVPGARGARPGEGRGVRGVHFDAGLFVVRLGRARSRRAISRSSSRRSPASPRRSRSPS